MEYYYARVKNTLYYKKANSEEEFLKVFKKQHSLLPSERVYSINKVPKASDFSGVDKVEEL